MDLKGGGRRRAIVGARFRLWPSGLRRRRFWPRRIRDFPSDAVVGSRSPRGDSCGAFGRAYVRFRLFYFLFWNLIGRANLQPCERNEVAYTPMEIAGASHGPSRQRPSCLQGSSGASTRAATCPQLTSGGLDPPAEESPRRKCRRSDKDKARKKLAYRPPCSCGRGHAEPPKGPLRTPRSTSTRRPRAESVCTCTRPRPPTAGWDRTAGRSDHRQCSGRAHSGCRSPTGPAREDHATLRVVSKLGSNLDTVEAIDCPIPKTRS